jgi:hypothetical protein
MTTVSVCAVVLCIMQASSTTRKRGHSHFYLLIVIALKVLISIPYNTPVDDMTTSDALRLSPPKKP